MVKMSWRPVLLMVLAGCAPVNKLSHPGWKNQVITRPFLDAQEVYFEIDPKNGMVLLRGYAPSVEATSESGARLAKSKELIKKNQLCKDLYNFETMKSIGERAYNLNSNGKTIPVFECQLQFTSKDFGQSLEDLFSHLCRRDLVVAVGPEELGVNYYGEGLSFSSHNALSHLFMKDKEGNVVRSAIFWKSNLDKYFGVFGITGKGYTVSADTLLFRDEIASAKAPGSVVGE